MILNIIFPSAENDRKGRVEEQVGANLNTKNYLNIMTENEENCGEIYCDINKSKSGARVSVGVEQNS